MKKLKLTCAHAIVKHLIAQKILIEGKKKDSKNTSSSSNENFAFGILRFVVVAIVIGVGEEIEIDKHLNCLMTIN